MALGLPGCLLSSWSIAIAYGAACPSRVAVDEVPWRSAMSFKQSPTLVQHLLATCIDTGTLVPALNEGLWRVGRTCRLSREIDRPSGFPTFACSRLRSSRGLVLERVANPLTR